MRLSNPSESAIDYREAGKRERERGWMPVIPIIGKSRELRTAGLVWWKPGKGICDGQIFDMPHNGAPAIKDCYCCTTMMTTTSTTIHVVCIDK